MCRTCGCGQPDGEGTRLTIVHGHEHEHDASHRFADRLQIGIDGGRESGLIGEVYLRDSAKIGSGDLPQQLEAGTLIGRSCRIDRANDAANMKPCQEIEV